MTKMKNPFKSKKEEVSTPAPVEKKLKVPVDILLEECIKGVIHEVAKEHHAEAKEIIRLGSDDDRKEFLKYYKEDKGNICCLVLDRIKRDLIANGKMAYDKEAAFGHPFML
jgi:hypothetical protein